jgi:hypothetical protein
LKLDWLDICLELAISFGTTPHEVAHWPWKRVHRYWDSWRKRQRRELRFRTLDNQHAQLNAVSGLMGGAAPAIDSQHNEDGSLNDRGLRRLASLGVPVQSVETAGE